MQDRLLAIWREASRDLDLKIDAPFRLVLASGAEVDVRLRLRDFGAVNGMLIVTDFDLLAPHAKEVVTAGFGYSTLSEPRPDAEYDRESFVEMLEDWGWSGPEPGRPSWYSPARAIGKVSMNSLLEHYDDPEHWEQPAGFDWSAESRSFAAFVADLKRRFDRTFEVETGQLIQDASFHSQIALPGGWLRFSKFGRMIALTPGSEVPDNILAGIHDLAEEHRYTLVPTADLERPYPRGDGVRLGIRTWWIRYFDWL